MELALVYLAVAFGYGGIMWFVYPAITVTEFMLKVLFWPVTIGFYVTGFVILCVFSFIVSFGNRQE